MMKYTTVSVFRRKQLTPGEEFSWDNKVDTDTTDCLLFVCLTVYQCYGSSFCLPVFRFIVSLTFSTMLGFIILINGSV